MYRTATMSAYDVLDTIFINAVVTEYEGTPGASEKTQFTWSASLPSTGEADTSIWLWKALQALQATLDQA